MVKANDIVTQYDVKAELLAEMVADLRAMSDDVVNSILQKYKRKGLIE